MSSPFFKPQLDEGLEVLEELPRRLSLARWIRVLSLARRMRKNYLMISDMIPRRKHFIDASEIGLHCPGIL